MRELKAVVADTTLDKYHHLLNTVFYDMDYDEFYKVLKISFVPKQNIWEATCVVVDKNGVPLESVMTPAGKPIENELVGYSLEDADGKEDPSIFNMIKDYKSYLDDEQTFVNQKKKTRKKKWKCRFFG